MRRPQRAAASTHTFHKYCITVPARLRNALVAYLDAHGVETKVYYATPTHLEPAYRECRTVPATLVHAPAAAAGVLAIPIHSAIGEAQQQHVATTIRRFFAERAG